MAISVVILAIAADASTSHLFHSCNNVGDRTLAPVQPNCTARAKDERARTGSWSLELAFGAGAAADGIENKTTLN